MTGLTDCSPDNELNSGYRSFSSFHRDGANFLLCDGSVRFVKNDTEPITYRRISMRNDGRPIGEY